MSSYQEPAWARSPPADCDWSIEEIKGGVEIASHQLNLPCTTFGRAADMVTVPTAHESCSRLHARIAFDREGTPWLRDLGSAHGTTVNKRPLPRKAVGKSESIGTGEGSRGVVVYPGDTIQFGASTRMFCIVGPPAYDRGAIRLKKTEDTSTESINSSHSPNPSGDGVSWGIDTEEYPEDDEINTTDKASLVQLDHTEIPERHRKAFEQLMAKKYKLSNLQTESERIRNKGAVQELSAGQTAQLERNREREATLQRDVEKLEQDLRQKIQHGSQVDESGSRKRQRDDEYDAEDDVDDFYDRTKREAKEGKRQVETEKSLTARWKNLHSSLERNAIKTSRSQERVKKLQVKINKAEEIDDDVFFIQNDLNLAEDEMKKLIKCRNTIEQEMNEVEKLLKIVNDKIKFDRVRGLVGDALVAVCPATAMPSPGDVPALGKTPTAMMPPPPPKNAATPPQSVSGTSDISPVKPVAGTSVAVECSLSKKSLIGKDTEKVSTELLPKPRQGASQLGNKPRGPVCPPTGTISAVLLRSSGVGSTQEEQKQKGSGTDKDGMQSGLSGPLASGPKAFDPKKDEWRPPEGQDGSGVTKLNKKFAGRY